MNRPSGFYVRLPAYCVVRGIFLCVMLWQAVLAIPVTALADKVGALMPTSNIPYFVSAHKAMEAELATQGITAEFILQKPAPSEMAWKNAIRKLVTLEAKVIVTYGAATALAAKEEAQDIPIVFTGAFEPESVGVSGKNITGCDAKVPINALLNNLKKIANPAKLGILYSSDELDSVKQAEAAAAQSAAAGMEAVKTDVKGASGAIELPATQAVLLTSSGAVQNQKALEAIIAKAKANKVVTASLLGGGEQGVVITLAANPEQQGQDAAKMVASILKGATASSVPANTSPRVELILNLVEAKALGLNIPFEVLGTAKVIK